MATGPKPPKTPLELLENNDREDSVIAKYYTPVACGVIAFVSVCIGNFATKRPVFSGIQKHAFFTGSFAAIGAVIDSYRNDYFADRDAMFRHYIQLHPEDFPPYESQKYADLLLPWIPIR